MQAVTLVFPHQLFEHHPAISRDRPVVLLEDSLFFGDSRNPLRFHQKKLLLHRASMKAYEKALRQAGHQVQYVEHEPGKDLTGCLHALARGGAEEFHYVDPVDYLVERRLARFFTATGLRGVVVESPQFLTPDDWRQSYFQGRKRWLMGGFYQAQRRRMGVLMTAENQPAGGRWSFDEENRKRFPKAGVPPLEPRVGRAHPGMAAAASHVQERYGENPGSTADFDYPVTPAQASRWLANFMEERLAGFGDYEDALSRQHRVLYHSVLTPSLNLGLLTPQQVLDAALATADAQRIPLNSLEGFVRQIIGWREFIRGVYVEAGTRARTTNYWGFTRRLPAAFYTGQTGIPPVDAVIHRTLEHGWCHHIERLMVLGNFMLLCRIHPDDVYAWFMEMFVDAYDWVMVPNVYGMSQFADGGTFTTKPYLSGSNYLLKMGDYPKGPWCAIWDALFWTFIADYEDFFAANPRLSLMTRQLARLRGPALEEKRRLATAYLETLGLGEE